MAKRRGGLTDSVKKQTAPKRTVESASQISIEDQERAIRDLAQGQKTKTHTRVSVDFPIDLYERMKADTKRRGQTLRGFIVAMVRDHYDEQ